MENGSPSDRNRDDEAEEKDAGLRSVVAVREYYDRVRVRYFDSEVPSPVSPGKEKAVVMEPSRIELGPRRLSFRDHPSSSIHRPQRSYPKPHQPSTPHSAVTNTIATTPTAGASTSTSTGGHSLALANLSAAANGGGAPPGHLESQSSSLISRSWRRRILNIVGYGTTATGGGHAPDLEAGGERAARAQQPSVNQEAAKTFRQFSNQVFSTLVVASPMANFALKDAPKHVKIIIFVGQAVIFIVMFTAILYTELAYHRMAFLVVSCLAFALSAFIFASQL